MFADSEFDDVIPPEVKSRYYQAAGSAERSGSLRIVKLPEIKHAFFTPKKDSAEEAKAAAARELFGDELVAFLDSNLIPLK